MKRLKKSVVAVGLPVTLAMLLVACDGSSNIGPDRQIQSAIDSSLRMSDMPGIAGSTTDTPSLSTAGAADYRATYDLNISGGSSLAGESASRSLAMQFNVVDAENLELPMEKMSAVLEVAIDGSFVDPYRIPMFDFQTLDTPGAMSARAVANDIPTGSYSARIVVNPNWQNAFEYVPANTNHSEVFRHFAERDYTNNISSTFLVTSSANVQCIEDGFEHNDTLVQAYPLPVGAEVQGALCNDNVDFFALTINGGGSASINVEYTGNVQAMRYAVIGPDYTRIVEPQIIRSGGSIGIRATRTGEYYIALHGARASYSLSRDTSSGVLSSDDSGINVFTDQTAVGPYSWRYGQIGLQKLAITEDALSGATVNCGRISTQYNSNHQPVAYVTPNHFAENHLFKFTVGGEYTIDDEVAMGWSIADGDIKSAAWYQNPYPGYAQKVSTSHWRYWSVDGLGYVNCEISGG